MSYSIQLFTVRDALEADLPRTIRRLAEIGYRQVEPCSFEDRTEEFAEAFTEDGVTAPTGHSFLIPVGTSPDHSPDQEGVFAAAKRLGIGTVIHPYLPAEHWQDAETIRGTAELLNAAAKKGAEYGIRVGYHNHDWEISSKIAGTTALEFLAEMLDPEVVLEVDVYWAAVGGQDPAALLRRLGDRVVAIHIKDGPVSKDTRAQLPAGQGEMDIWGIIAAAKNLEVGIVEFDDYAGDIFEGVASSLRYLQAGPAATPSEEGDR
jgi:sugar phosphate isomerase/epimerase